MKTSPPTITLSCKLVHIAVATLCLLALPHPQAQAASGSWSGATNASWITTTNWNSGAVPGTGDTATFNGASANTTVDLGAGVTISTIIFDTSSAAAYTIGSGAVNSQALTLNNGGAITMNSTVANNETVNAALVLGTDGTAQTFTLTNNSTTNALTVAGGIVGSTGSGVKTLAVAGAGSTTLSGIIGNGTTGSVALTKSGAGTLTLNAANTYSGGTTISGGILTLGVANALNTTTGVINFTGGTLQYGSGVTTDYSGRVSTNASQAISIDTNGNNVTFATAITGNASSTFTKLGAGTLITTAANTWTGQTTITGGTLQLGSAGTTGALSISSAIVDNGTLAINRSNAVTQGTDFSGAAITGAGGLTQAGGGTTVLNNTGNSYGGATTISGGVLQLGASGVLPDGTVVTISNGAKLILNGFSETIGGLATSDATTSLVEASESTSGKSGTLTVNQATNTIFDGILRDHNTSTSVLTLVKSGVGNLTLKNSTAAGSTNFTGATTISSGTLTLSDSNGKEIASWASAITDNASLALESTTANNRTLGKVISGAGDLTITSANVGSITLSQLNSFTGNVVVNSGTLINTGASNTLNPVVSGLGNPQTANRTITVNNGGTLSLNIGNSFGNTNSTPVVTTIINQGGIAQVNAGDANTFGNITLNGGTLRVANNGFNNGFQAIVLGGNVTVGGNAASTIDITATPSATTSVMLGANTIFNVGSTGAAGYDLTVSNRLTWPQGQTSAAGGGGFTKTGAGSMVLTGVNTYGGVTTIENGALVAGGNSAVSTDGAFGNASSALALGDATSISSNLSPSLLIGGAFTVGRSITVGSSNTATSGVYTIGGNTANTSTFSGIETLNQSLTVSQFSGGTLNLTGNITSGASGAQTLTFNNAGSISQSTGVIGGGVGTIAVTKSGAGTTTLSGANTYAGATSINAGTLIFAGTGSIGSVSVADSATLGTKLSSPSASVVAATNLTFGTSGTSNFAVDFNFLSNPSVAVVALSGILTLNGTVNVSLANVSNLASATNSLRLLSYASQTGPGIFNLTTTSVGHTTFALNDTSTALYLNVTAATNIWTGASSNIWDIGTAGGGTGSHNWSLGDQVYLDGDVVAFDDTAQNNNFNVNIASPVSPSSVTFSNSSAHTYTLSGSGIAGTGALTLNGANGTVILTNTNSYTGITTIGPGDTLQLGNGTTDGSINSSASIIDSGTLIYNRSTGSSFTYNNVISGAGALTKSGLGTQILTGSNSYSGATTISAGTLQIGAGSTTGALSPGSAITDNGTLAFNRSNAVVQGTDFSTAAITGIGSVTQLGSSSLTLNAANSFSGGVNINAGSVSVANVGNSGANSNLGTNGTVNIGATATGGTLLYTGAGETSNKVINLAGTTGGATIDQSGASLLKFTGNLTATGVGVKTLTLQGSTAGTGEIAGAIVDSSGGATSVTKAGTNTWTLSGNNTYTGATTVSAGTLSFQGGSALPSASAVSLGAGTLQVLNNGTGSSGTISLGNSVTINSATTADTINVGNNGSNTANTVAFGALSNGTPADANAVTINFTGANGYLESFSSLALSGSTGQNTTLNPTTTSVTITGNVTNQQTSFSGRFDTLTLDGTSSGNFINGAISNSSGYTSVGNGDTRITKSNSSTWTLAGNNTYSGPTTVSAGILVLSGSNNNGATSTISVSNGATLQLQANAGNTVSGTSFALGTASGKLSLANGSTLQLRSNTNVNFNGTDAIGGLNGLTIAIDVNNITAGTANGATNGGTQNQTLSLGSATTFIGTTGQFNITGGDGYTLAFGALQTGNGTGNTETFNPTSASVTIASYNNGVGASNTLALAGTSTGNAVLGAITNTTGSLAVTKSGASTWTLGGVNTYTGATTISAGTLKINGQLTASAVTVGGNGASGTPTLGGGIGNANGGSLATPTGASYQVYASSATVGNVQGTVTVNGPGTGVAGILSPGNSVGTLTIGTLTMNAGSIANYEFNTTTPSNDFTAVTASGGLSLTGVGFNLYLEGTTTQFNTMGTYALFSYAGTATMSGLSVLNPNGADTYTFNNDATNHLITLTIAASNDSALTITPSPISLGNVLVGATPVAVTGTLTNNGTVGTGSYALAVTGSASASGSGTLATAGGSTTFTVGSTGAVTSTSGNGVVLGTVGASNSANPSGSATPVNVTVNVFQVASLTPTVTSGTSLVLTNAASTDGGQRAGVTVTGFTSSNPNFVTTLANSGTVGTANGSDMTTTVGTVSVASNRLSGTYSYTGSVTGSAHYTDAALAAQSGVTSPIWTGVSITGTVTGATSSGSADVKQAFISSGSSYAGYGLTSGVTGGIGQGSNPTTATLLSGTASGDTTISMAFSANGGHPVNAFQSSDVLTLSGMTQAGTGADGQILTASPFVLQMSYVPNVNNVNNIYYIGWYDATRGAWVNAIAGNSNAVLPRDYIGSGAFQGTYADYMAANPTLTTLGQQLGAYGYVYNAGDPSQDVVWAVLDHNSDFEAIPEPSTYAMIFSGFGMLIGFQRIRNRRSFIGKK